MHLTSPVPAISLTQGRLCLVAAALLWSLSGAFTRILTLHTPLHLGPDPVPGLVIAFYRVFFAALVLAPALRRADVSFRRGMLVMVAFFALMNITFVWALAEGTSSNAVLLQYTGPIWMSLASVWWLGEPWQGRSFLTLTIGLCGIFVIFAGGWYEAQQTLAARGQLLVAGIALLSGFAYAGVIVFLRVLRDASSRWLTILNHGGSALVLIPFILWLGPRMPTPAELGMLAAFGAVQMALPYWLAARGLRVVSPQEAGAITLLEPLLNPLWAFLVAPARETPSIFTWIGGAFILGSLICRYFPRSH